MAFIVGFSFLSANATPLITEFMADNTETLADEDGDFPDWIEIHNPDAAAVDLDGWTLTDNATNLTKWTFPPATILVDSSLFLLLEKTDKFLKTNYTRVFRFRPVVNTWRWWSLAEPQSPTSSHQNILRKILTVPLDWHSAAFL
jgi:hypothetical protein